MIARHDEFACPCCGEGTDGSFCAPCRVAECLARLEAANELLRLHPHDEQALDAWESAAAEARAALGGGR